MSATSCFTEVDRGRWQVGRAADGPPVIELPAAHPRLLILRVVADANVVVSAALARSPQAPSVLIFDAALDGRVELVTSPALLREVTNVLARPRL